MMLPAAAWTHWWQPAAALGIGLVAGVINTIAGGGTILTFPTLVWLGLPPLAANIANSVGVLPGGFTGTWGFRDEIRAAHPRWHWLFIPSITGGLLGAVLLLHTSANSFESLAPILVLLATLIILIEPWLKNLGASSGRAAGEGPGPWRLGGLLGIQFLLAIYGSYFGAGNGILMLSLFGLFEIGGIRMEMGMKNAYGLLINFIAVIYFIALGVVSWRAAIWLGVGTFVGGLTGATMAHRLRRSAVRWIVIGIGVVVTLALLRL